MNEALFRRNALACETAQSHTCRCACGGTLHGKLHSEQWIVERVDEWQRARDYALRMQGLLTVRAQLPLILEAPKR